MKDRTLVLKGASVLVGDDLVPRREAVVTVERGLVTEVGQEVSPPPSARVLDLSGHTVLPGLIDTHVHLGATESAPVPPDGARAVMDRFRFRSCKWRGFLRHGVTTVCSLGDENEWVHTLRRKAASGVPTGPRLLIAGPLFTTPGGHPVATIGADPDADWVRLPRSPEHAREQVGALVTGDDPVDVVKVVHDRGDPRYKNLEPFDRAVLAAIVDEAHRHGRAVAAHWGTLTDLEELLDAGADHLHHLEPRGPFHGWPPHLLAEMVRRGTALAPTLAVTGAVLDPDTTAVLRQRAAEFHAAGGTLLAGSDAGMSSMYAGEGLIREVELLAEAGLTAREALVAATSAPARALGASRLGVVGPGRAADLLVVRGDPLTDLGALRRVALVLRDGRVVVDRTGEKA